LKKLVIILFTVLSFNAYSQIGMSYSIGSIGGMPKVTGISSPILISSENCFLISNNINYNLILDKFEDYLSGVELTFDMSTISDFDACDIPLN